MKNFDWMLIWYSLFFFIFKKSLLLWPPLRLTCRRQKMNDRNAERLLVRQRSRLKKKSNIWYLIIWSDLGRKIRPMIFRHPLLFISKGYRRFYRNTNVEIIQIFLFLNSCFVSIQYLKSLSTVKENLYLKPNTNPWSLKINF